MIDRPRNPGALLLALAVVLNVIGPSTFNVLPLLVEGAEHSLGFSDRQIGVMSFAISLGSGASALVAGLWVRSVRWPRAAFIALGGVVVANALAALMQDYWLFVLLQGIAGFFGGSVLCLSATILSDRHDSARAFGIGVAAQVLFQVLALLTGPALFRWAGLSGLLIMLAGLAALAMPLAPLFPAHGRAVPSEGVPKALLRPAVLIGLAAYCIFFVNAGAYWTYIEPMGRAHGMTASVVSNSIAAGVSAGFFGGVLAWALGDRFGKLWPLGVVTCLMIVAALLLRGPFSVTGFVSSGVMYYLAWNCAVAYQCAIINSVDATGRAVAISLTFGYIGAAAGAAFAGLLITPSGYGAVTWLMVIAASLSTVLFGISSVVHKYGRL